MDIGLKYKAMAEKKIDIMPIFTTDGQLSHADITVLKDDKHLYPSYMCGNVVREETLKKHPELEDVLKKFNSTITDKDMQKMNYEVETEKKEPAAVAKAYLKSKGLLK